MRETRRWPPNLGPAVRSKRPARTTPRDRSQSPPPSRAWPLPLQTAPPGRDDGLQRPPPLARTPAASNHRPGLKTGSPRTQRTKRLRPTRSAFREYTPNQNLPSDARIPVGAGRLLGADEPALTICGAFRPTRFTTLGATNRG